MGLDDLLPEKPQLEKDDFELQEAPLKAPCTSTTLFRNLVSRKYNYHIQYCI
jgi:hypothetical protein